MTIIESAGVPGALLAEYAAIPISFEVRSVVSAQPDGGQSFVLTEHRVSPPYIKDYDTIGDHPLDWADRFDTSQWIMGLARVEGRGVGGVTVALGESGLGMLEGRSDLAVLWDIRVETSLSRWRHRAGVVRGGRSVGTHARMRRVEGRDPEHQCSGVWST